MPFQLTLTLPYRSDTAWRWVLTDPAGHFLADHGVALDRAYPVHPRFEDPRARRLVDVLETTIVEREQLQAMKAINEFFVAQLPAIPSSTWFSKRPCTRA